MSYSSCDAARKNVCTVLKTNQKDSGRDCNDGTKIL